MKEVAHKYFFKGVEVNREDINWEYSNGFTIIGDEVHVDFDPSDEQLVYNKPVEETQEIDVETLCNFLSLVGGGAYPGLGLRDGQNKLGNLKQTETQQSYQAKDYPQEVVASSPEDGIERLCIQSNGSTSMGITNPTAKLHVSGVKHNKFKAPLDIVQTRQFPKALQLIALATAFGNKKYEATDKDFLNFKRVAGGSQTYFDAAARHNAERNDVDDDSGLPHIIHSVWDSLAALELWIEENNIDTKEFSKNYLENLHISK